MMNIHTNTKSIDGQKGWFNLCDRIDRLPEFMVSNRVRRSSILCSDEKLVYKMDRIEYTTTRLIFKYKSFFNPFITT